MIIIIGAEANRRLNWVHNNLYYAYKTVVATHGIME